MTYYIGIDPGWKNLGFAIVKAEPSPDSFKVEVVTSQTLNPSSFGSIDRFTDHAVMLCDQTCKGKRDYLSVEGITMERYVAYKGVLSSETENITMVIGSLNYGLYRFSGLHVGLTRALDWKIEMAQLLNKHAGFTNPSMSLDKKFSIAAAKHICTSYEKVNNDHEADAVCLAALPFLKNRFGK